MTNIENNYICGLVGLQERVIDIPRQSKASLNNCIDFRMQLMTSDDSRLAKDKDTYQIFIVFIDKNEDPIGNSFVMLFECHETVSDLKSRVRDQLVRMGSIMVGDQDIKLDPDNWQLFVYKVDEEESILEGGGGSYFMCEMTPIQNFHDPDGLSHILISHLEDNIANIAIMVNTGPTKSAKQKLSIIE
jgi:hypothetical protein